MASDKSRVTKKILDYFSERMKEWTLNNAGGSSVTEDRVLGIEADIEALETSMDDMDGAISGEGGLSERVQALEDAGTGGGGESVTLEDLGITVSADSINKIDDIQNGLIPVLDALYYPYVVGKSLVHYQEVSFSIASATDSDITYNTYIDNTTYNIIGYAVVGNSKCPVAAEFYRDSSNSYKVAIRPHTTNTSSLYYPVTGTVFVIYSK